MDLSTTQATLLLLGCVVVIGGIFVAYRRGWLGAKTDEKAPAGSTKA